MREGWELKRLGEVLRIQNGYAFNSKLFTTELGVPLIRIRDIKNGFKTETNFNGPYEKKYEVHAGDFLIGMDGEFGCHEWKGDKALLNQRVCRLQEFNDRLNPRFLLYGINKYLKAIEEVTAFATVKHISSKQIEAIEISLPPLPEQQRIVAILDECFAALEKAKANAEQNLKNAKELFESYLQGVFENGNWEKKKWSELCTFVRGPFGGSLKKSVFKESGYVVYEQKHAIHDHFNQLRYFIDEEKFKEMNRFELLSGDIIMSCSGVTLGRVAVVPEGIPKGIINQALLKLTPKENASVHFIKYWLRSTIFQKIIFDFSGGAAIPNVPSAKILKDIKIPCPSIKEQEKIVSQIETVLNETHRLQAIYQQKLADLEELKKSILHKAFAGELTDKSIAS
jgi:type I restriction enzyme S subunit